MYRITCDGLLLLDTRREDYIVLEPKVNVETNTVGECSFIIYNNHPHYNDMHPLKSMFEVSDENGVLFRGRMTNNTRDFYNGKAVDLEGAMAFFNDSMVKPFVFPDDFSSSITINVVEYFLRWLIEQHNQQVKPFQRFKLGNVTVTDPNNYISRSSESIASTWDILKGKLFESNLGGYLCIRYEEDGNYIDYLADFEDVNTQEIRLGQNLLDMKCELDASATYSAIIPLGADIEVEEDGETITKKLTLESIPDGKLNNADDTYKVTLDNGLHAIYSKSAVENYGWICCPVGESTWDDVTDANNLKNKARTFLLGTASLLGDNIEVTAADLHFADSEVRSFRIYKKVNVISKPHNIDTFYNLSKLEIDLLNPQNTKIVVGTPSKTLTAAISGSGSSSSGSSGSSSGGSGGGGISEEIDPTVPAWAKQPNKPTYTASEVGARPNTWMPTASDVGADSKGTAELKVSGHNTNTEAHNDIRLLIEGLTTRLNTLADSDDVDLDQMSELVAYIKSNRELIEEVTTNKVNVSDIIDNLTTNVSNKPLSAAQGVALKSLIDGLTNNKLSRDDVINNLTTYGGNVPLSANQGRILKEYIDGLENSKADKSITLSGYGITDGALKSDLTKHTSDEDIHITANERTAWNGKAEPSDIPTKVSELENDSKYLTEIPSEYITEEELKKKGYLTEVPDSYVTEAELEDKGYLTEVPSEYMTSELLEQKGYMTEAKLNLGLYNVVKSVNNIRPDSNGNVDIVGEDGSLKHTHTWADIAATYDDLVVTSDGANHGGYVKVSNEVLTLKAIENGGSVSFIEGAGALTTLKFPDELTVYERTNGAVIAFNGLPLVVIAFEDGMTYMGNTFEKGISFAQDSIVITHTFRLNDYVLSSEITPIPPEYLPTEYLKELIKEVILEIVGENGVGLQDISGADLYDVLQNKLITKE